MSSCTLRSTLSLVDSLRSFSSFLTLSASAEKSCGGERGAERAESGIWRDWRASQIKGAAEGSRQAIPPHLCARCGVGLASRRRVGRGGWLAVLSVRRLCPRFTVGSLAGRRRRLFRLGVLLLDGLGERCARRESATSFQRSRDAGEQAPTVGELGTRLKQGCKLRLDHIERHLAGI